MNAEEDKSIGLVEIERGRVRLLNLISSVVISQMAGEITKIEAAKRIKEILTKG